MRKYSGLMKYKFYLVFQGGKELAFETNTDIRTAKREFINGSIFVSTENNYTINISQLTSLKVKIQH
ncbi:hypothetical protein WAX74_03285 [Psychrobacillus sp. FJAT-51614]|uniref:Uncharacterized protein n=1 Tax=Psychrobacillus mangrovi TaxID=3117745 RepID=A0ABU8F113_9BACI